MTRQAERLFEIGKLYSDRGDYTLALPNMVEASEIFLNEIAKHSNLEVQLVTKFVIADLSSRPKTNLQSYFKDVFFKVSTNKSGIIEKIATFKRF